MKLSVDTDAKTLTVDGKTMDLYSDKAFEILSEQSLKVGWNQKYPYYWSWMGIPIVQLPEDIIRTQEVIWKVKPDVIIECGVAHGGGVIFYASLCKAMDKGRVIGVELEYRGNHRTQVEEHLLAPLITLIEGSSTDPAIVKQVKSLIKPGETVMVLLDSNHTKKHVADELEAYYDVITKDSYIVATDGSMEILYDVPRGKPEWIKDSPAEAAREFVAKHPEFIIDNPVAVFNESTLTKTPTHWPDAWLKRIG